MIATRCTMCEGSGHVPAGHDVKDEMNSSNMNIVRMCATCGGSGKMSKAMPVSKLFELMGITPKGSMLEEMFHQDEPDVKWNGKPINET